MALSKKKRCLHFGLRLLDGTDLSYLTARNSQLACRGVYLHENLCYGYHLTSMTSGTNSLDTLVKEYLIFRGFVLSARQFDSELKTDKDRGFRVSNYRSVNACNNKDAKCKWQLLPREYCCDRFNQLLISISFLSYYILPCWETSIKLPCKQLQAKVKLKTEMYLSYRDWCYINTDAARHFPFPTCALFVFFQADLVVDTIVSFIANYDLQSLKDFWKYLDERVFSRLEVQYHASTKKLYFSILKYYVVYAVTNHK